MSQYQHSVAIISGLLRVASTSERRASVAGPRPFARLHKAMQRPHRDVGDGQGCPGARCVDGRSCCLILFKERSRSPHDAVASCVGAAVDAVAIANAMDGRAMLYEAYALTVEVLTMAATVLSFVETCEPGDELAARARVSNSQARVLLETLARQSCAAALCLESLNVSSFSSFHDEKQAHGAIRSLSRLSFQLNSARVAPLTLSPASIHSSHCCCC